jgi:endonuclease/exonuclease/phosphatase family metal-dependent hydrolase
MCRHGSPGPAALERGSAGRVAGDDVQHSLRYGDGVNQWENRKEFLVETIRAFDPDLLGTQETLGFQRDYLAEHLPGYGVLGVGRDDGKEQGEMMALYYRQARFTPLEQGHFWLSQTPDVAGSKSWDSSLPRMVTWIKLRDLQAPQARPIASFNTHFDHRGPQARLEAARLLRERIAAAAQECDVILTGDFNSPEGSPPYRALFDRPEGQPRLLVDCFRAAHPTRGEQEGTSTPFDPKRTNGPRIDWIACTPGFDVLEAKIDRAEREGRTPSDHFPVEVVLRRK